jgi:hypothetical protein
MASPTPPPSITLVNRESRAETLVYYLLLSFPTVESADRFLPTRFRFNPSIDTLRLAGRCVNHPASGGGDGDQSGPPEAMTHGRPAQPSACLRIGGTARCRGSGIEVLNGEGRERDVREGRASALRITIPTGAPPPLPTLLPTWADLLCHLAFDASLFSADASWGGEGGGGGVAPDPDRQGLSQGDWGNLMTFVGNSPSMRTVTITMASAPARASSAPKFPFPDDPDESQTHNVRTMRIAPKPTPPEPDSDSPPDGGCGPEPQGPGGSDHRDASLEEDGVFAFYEGSITTFRKKNLAIFEVLDPEQAALLTDPDRGPNALALRASWLMRAMRAPPPWKIVPRPNGSRDRLHGNLALWLHDWVISEKSVNTTRLAAICHGMCVPNYGF